ncbi:hypothetical protein BKA70DRAFT_1325881 [Coprinopsis sp. MPI-PUGE-AT-0042]|nr:hypothetical protein BKA70DRAFT_1325881 [Coprinopsis sp. MPI-PUGE-AT-0042]
MLTPPLSILPSDLIDEIVNWVAVLGSSEGICTLLQVDREFGPRCRVHIFRALRVRVGRFGRVPALRRLVEKNPHIVPYVQEVQLVFQNQDSNQMNLWPPTPNPDLAHLTHSLASSPNPPSSLEIRAYANMKLRVNSPGCLTQWLTTSFFSSTLLNLSLSNITNFPLRAIQVCRALRSLKVRSVNITISKKEMKPRMNGGSIPELEVLEFEKSQDCVEKLAERRRSGPRYASFKRLKVIKARIEDNVQIPLLETILNQAQRSLEELHLRMSKGTSRQAPSKFLNLQNLQQLRRLFLSATLVLWNRRPRTVVADIVEMMSSVPTTNNHLESISLGFTVQETSPYSAARNQDWIPLAREISRISSGRSMKFGVRLRTPGSDEERKDLVNCIDGDIRLSLDMFPHVNVRIASDPL